jgi:hypothetical protein
MHKALRGIEQWVVDLEIELSREQIVELSTHTTRLGIDIECLKARLCKKANLKVNYEKI